MKSNLRTAEQYAYCWGFTPFSWFYNLLKLLTTVPLFAPCIVLQTWHHTNYGPPRVGSAIRNMMLANLANLQAADSPRWTNLIRDAKSVATPTVM